MAKTAGLEALELPDVEEDGNLASPEDATPADDNAAPEEARDDGGVVDQDPESVFVDDIPAEADDGVEQQPTDTGDAMPPGVSPAIVQQALAMGFDPDTVAEIGDTDRLLALMQKVAGQPPSPPQAPAYQPPPTPAAPVAPQPPASEAFPELDPAEYGAEQVALLKQIGERVQASDVRAARAEAAVEALQQRQVADQDRQQIETQHAYFDEQVKALGPKWEVVLGLGESLAMAEGQHGRDARISIYRVLEVTEKGFSDPKAFRGAVEYLFKDMSAALATPAGKGKQKGRQLTRPAGVGRGANDGKTADQRAIDVIQRSLDEAES